MNGDTATATVKAYLETEKGEQIRCLFNPAELTLRKATTWAADTVVGRATPNLYFTGGVPGELTMALLFDTTHDGTSVTRYTNALLDLLRVDPDLPGHDNTSNRGRPPWVRFHWGDLHSFKAIIEQFAATFTFFASDGTPLRARTNVTLKQFEDDAAWAPQNPTSGTPRPHRVHQVQRGESLDAIASRYYGDPTCWRLLAETNNILDPFALEPGRVLVIPRLRGGEHAGRR